MMSRNTVQKKVIESEIIKLNSFFDAEQLYSKVIKKNKRIGIASIYRFLRNLVDNEKIHSYLCDRKTLYSLNINNHCHFTCKKCGQSRHINIKKLDFLKSEIKNDICHFQIDVTGRCMKCMKKQ